MRQTLVAVAIVCVCAVAVTAQAPDTKPATVARSRARLLGVYYELSAEPVDGVRASDVMNGTSMLTSSTGTVSLVFMPDGGGLVRLQKIGYETQTFFVAISPSDTAPL